jgi:peroxiredoxin
MIEEGKPAPDVALPSDSGERIKLSSLRGKPVVLYFYPKTRPHREALRSRVQGDAATRRRGRVYVR